MKIIKIVWLPADNVGEVGTLQKAWQEAQKLKSLMRYLVAAIHTRSLQFWLLYSKGLVSLLKFVLYFVH